MTNHTGDNGVVQFPKKEKWLVPEQEVPGEVRFFNGVLQQKWNIAKWSNNDWETIIEWRDVPVIAIE